MASRHLAGASVARLLPDLQAATGPVYTALADGLSALVEDARIALDTRLPSERELATALGVSRATVTAAYDTLRERGYLISRTGSGSFATVPAGARPRRGQVPWSAVAGTDPVLDLTCATLPAVPEVAPAATRAAHRLPAYLHGDGYDPAGLPELRAAVAERYRARGVPTDPEQVLVTGGALHALDLVLRLLVGPGDRVLTELPTYPGALDAVRAVGGRLVPVPMDPAGGWQVDELTAALRQATPRVAYLVPDHHNPTGVLVPDDARRAVLAEARRTGTTVVVDESLVDLGYDASSPDAHPMAALDRDVVSIGSLSKVVWGGLRIGWIRASTDLVHRLAARRAGSDLGGPVLEQLAAADLVPDLDAIAATRRTELRGRRDALVAALTRELPAWGVPVPAGGLSVWAELDRPVSTSLARAAARAGVVLVPGSRFGLDGTLERFLRLPFALPADRLEDAVARIAAVDAELRRSGPTSRPLVVA